jgi:hypothetical protein
MRQVLAADGYICVIVPNADCQAARNLGWRWHSFDLPYNLIQYSSKTLAIAGERAGLTVRSHRTYSLPRAVRVSIGLQRRYKWFIPQRITQRWLSETYVQRFAQQLDDQNCGEAILMEFVHAPPTLNLSLKST